jgi:predicted unusual protein kinase regulating ubiquinone biosynthesis (AarF/ABC1/UbiB family)
MVIFMLTRTRETSCIFPATGSVMIDFGMVGRVTDGRREQFIDFLQALIQKNEERHAQRAYGVGG